MSNTPPFRHSSGDGYSGPIDDRESQTIYWNGDGWIVLERSESIHNKKSLAPPQI